MSMKTLKLIRKQFHKFSLGVMPFEDKLVYTIERPFIQESKTFHRAGKPFDSCVPYGIYDLIPHDTEKHKNVWALVNHDLGVYHKRSEMRYGLDRFAILIHSGNYVTDVTGCICVGDSTRLKQGMPIVMNSVATIRYMRKYMGEYDKLEITEI